MSITLRKSCLYVLASGVLFALAGVLLGSGCGDQSSCGTDECEGTDGSCVSCPQAGVHCTMTPVGACSEAVHGVSCCADSGPGAGSGPGATSGGCTAQVCCGGLFECNGACYSTCVAGSQPCCTATSCTCYTPCC